MSRKNVTITLYMSELIYDFQNKTYLTGRSRRAAGTDAEAASNMQSSDDDEDVNQALRSIQLAYTELQAEMSDSLKAEIMSSSGSIGSGGVIGGISAGATATNKLLDKSNIEVKLSLTSNFPIALRDALASNIHDYIINKAVAEWFNLTNPTESEVYYKLAQLSMQNLHELLNRRERPVRQSVE